MNKRNLFIILLLLLLSTTNLQASTFSNYLPGGKNYLEEANFVRNQNTLSSINDILIKESTTYTLSFPGEGLIEFAEIQISSDNNVIMNDYATDLSGCSVDMAETICTFSTDGNDTYLSITIIAEGLGTYYNYYGMENFQLEEGSSKTEYEEYIIPLIDANSPHFNGAGAYIASYNDNATIRDIIDNHITVIDDIDGNITDQIEILSDNYTPNKNIVGEYIVDLKVSDAANNSAYFTLTVIVKDEIAPIMSGPNEIDISFNTEVTLDSLITDNYSAVDGHDGNLVVSIQSDNYTSNKTTTGSYEVVLRSVDSSDNEITKSININVVDQNPPTMSNNNEITVYHSNPQTINEIISSLGIIDDYDNSQSIEKVILVDTYTSANNKPGQYTLNLEAIDTSDNSALFTITISLVDDIQPTITGPNTYVFSYTNPKTLDEMINNIVVSDNYTSLDLDDLIISSDNYSNRTNEVGTFTIVVEIVDSSNNKTTREITVDVIDDQVPIIYVDNIMITVSENATFTKQDALNLLVKNKEIPDKRYNITVINDEYTGNEELPGKYLYSLKFDDEDGNSLQKDFIIEVPDNSSIFDDETLLRSVAIYSSAAIFLLIIIFKKKK